ncbi:MAG: hypothetical protein GY716_01855, partial [bacterium]|nr:hypothetical protein [bacterium]
MFRNSALAVALVLSLGAVIQAAEEQIIVPDTTTQIGTVGATAGQIVVFNPSTNSYSLDSSLSIPGNPELDAVHRLDNPEQFLFSTRNPQASQGVDPDELPQVLNASVYHNDVIRYEGGYVWTPGGNPPPPGTYSFFFCNLSVPTLHRLPGGSNIDAVYLEPDGSMVVSLDAAATLGVNQIDYERWDLIRYKRSGGSGCGNW